MLFLRTSAGLSVRGVLVLLLYATYILCSDPNHVPMLQSKSSQLVVLAALTLLCAVQIIGLYGHQFS
jgi:hypothetical protein